MQNRSQVALTGIQVTPVLVDASGRVVQQGNPVAIFCKGCQGPEQGCLGSRGKRDIFVRVNGNAEKTAQGSAQGIQHGGISPVGRIGQ